MFTNTFCRIVLSTCISLREKRPLGARLKERLTLWEEAIWSSTERAPHFVGRSLAGPTERDPHCVGRRRRAVSIERDCRSLRLLATLSRGLQPARPARFGCSVATPRMNLEFKPFSTRMHPAPILISHLRKRLTGLQTLLNAPAVRLLHPDEQPFDPFQNQCIKFQPELTFARSY